MEFSELLTNFIADSRSQLRWHTTTVHKDHDLSNKQRPKQTRFTDDQRVMHFLITTNSPFAVVDNDQFHDICSVTNIRTRKTYASAVLPRVALGLRDEIMKTLQQQVCVSLQTDSWSNAFNTSTAQGLFGE